MKTSLAFARVAAAAVLAGATGALRAADTTLDNRIETTFEKTHVYQTTLKDDAVKIASENGAVTLTGTVADDNHKSLAADTAASLPGVKSVDDRLVVTGEQPAAQSDRWITAKIRFLLLFHRNVSATKTVLAVKDGIVTLSGEAATMAQKELTAAYARDVEGVKGVKNEMTVSATAQPPERTVAQVIDDASITARVKLVLATHHSTSALRTKVATKLGIVTVGGTAKNAAEKELVTKLVADIEGVTKVVNDMSVETP